MEQAIATALPYIIIGIVILMSLTVHEFSHGFSAYLLGDHTAKDAGRLTLNPLRHLDLYGSIIVPGVLLLMKFLFPASGFFMFGWAKPVPVNPYAMRDHRWGGLLSAIAGPASNIFLALVCGVILIFVYPLLPPNNLLLIFLFQAVVINFVLAIFNLVPVPPLDGSRIWSSFLSPRAQFQMERYAPLFVLAIIFLFYDYISYLIGWILTFAIIMLHIPIVPLP